MLQFSLNILYIESFNKVRRKFKYLFLNFLTNYCNKSIR